MIPQGNGHLKEAIIHLGREPRSKSANRGWPIYPVGCVGEECFFEIKNWRVWTSWLREVTINPRQRMLIEIGNGKSACVYRIFGKIQSAIVVG